MHRCAASVVLSLSVWTGAATVADACSCSSIGSGRPCYECYKALFLGKVVVLNEIDVSDGHVSRRQRVVGFLVERVWKGPRVAIQTVYTGLGGPDCGFAFEIGKRYLVSAGEGAPYFKEPFGKQDQTLLTGVCSETALAEDAVAAIKSLDENYRAWRPRWQIVQ